MSKYTIVEGKKFTKDISNKIPNKILDSFKDWKDNQLKNDPQSSGEGIIKKFKPCIVIKKRFGDYRVLYTIKNTEVHLLEFKHRSQIYE